MDCISKAEWYRDLIQSITGLDLRLKTRRYPYYLLRYMVALRLEWQGFKMGEIADALGLRRSTLAGNRKQAQTALKYPRTYYRINGYTIDTIWEELIKQENGKEKNTDRHTGKSDVYAFDGHGGLLSPARETHDELPVQNEIREEA